MLKYHCTNCSYIYSPYLWDPEREIEPVTFFEDLDDFWNCPSCQSNKDDFVEIKENIQELTSLDNMIPQEENHTPFYFVDSNRIYVKVWWENETFIWDENHFIEYVWIFDENEDVVDTVFLPEIDEDWFLEFELPDLDFFEVRASCNLHWVWKWVEINQE